MDVILKCFALFCLTLKIFKECWYSFQFFNTQKEYIEEKFNDLPKVTQAHYTQMFL